MKLLYLDVETGGLDPTKNPIIQLSGLISTSFDGQQIDREFDFKLRPLPTDVLDDKALEINHTTKEELLDPTRLDQAEAYKKLKSIFLTYINRYNKEDKFYLVGQNVHFDYSFLLALWKKNGDDYLGSFIHYHKIDLIALTASLRLANVLPKERLPNLKLQTLCQVFGLGEQKHDSLDDIRKTRIIFLKIIEAIKGISLI